MQFIDRLADDLERHEGKRLTVYRDTLGHETVGIGHLVRDEDALHEGDTISEDRCQRLFMSDIVRALVDCDALYGYRYWSYPEELMLILANLMFNLGYSKMCRFVLFRRAVRETDYIEMARELENSLWFKQVGNRSREMVARLRAMGGIA